VFVKLDNGQVMLGRLQQQATTEVQEIELCEKRKVCSESSGTKELQCVNLLLCGCSSGALWTAPFHDRPDAEAT
jgi:hypothetical protein